MLKKLQIVTEPNRVLREKALDVTIARIGSKKIQDLIADMKVTLKATPDGVGLAAPQVGVGLRLFIVSDEAQEIDRTNAAKHDVQDYTSQSDVARTRAARFREKRNPDMVKPYPMRDWRYYVFINPHVVTKSRKKLDGPEGCLSVPGTFGNIKRQEKITVQALDEHGKKFTRGASRFFARVIQHELDHLEGALFIDHATHVVKAE